MAQIHYFRAAPTPAPTASKRCCERCGADLWTLTLDGLVRCADCEQIHPWRVQPLVERPNTFDTITQS